MRAWLNAGSEAGGLEVQTWRHDGFVGSASRISTGPTPTTAITAGSRPPRRTLSLCQVRAARCTKPPPAAGTAWVEVGAAVDRPSAGHHDLDAVGGVVVGR
jgi:hypothetical protein